MDNPQNWKPKQTKKAGQSKQYGKPKKTNKQRG